MAKSCLPIIKATLSIEKVLTIEEKLDICELICSYRYILYGMLQKWTIEYSCTNLKGSPKNGRNGHEDYKDD